MLNANYYKSFGPVLILILFGIPVRASVNVTNWSATPGYNAIGDGVTNNDTAFAQCLSYCQQSGQAMYIPVGTYVHNNPIIDTGVVITGAGQTATILQAANQSNSAVELEGNNPQLNNLEVDCPSANARQDCGWQSGIWVEQATNFTLQSVNVGDINHMGTGGSGIECFGVSHGLVQGCNVYNTLADGIHLTYGSNNIGVNSNSVTNSGDDMISVVSYQGEVVTQYNSITNNTCNGNAWGRGISVVGGNSIGIYGNTVSNSCDAGLYVCNESNTMAATNIQVHNNTLNNVNYYSPCSQGSILIYGNPGYITSNVTVYSNTVNDVAGLGIVVNSQYTSGISVYSNTVSVSPAPIANGTYALTPASAPGNRLTVPGQGTANGTALVSNAVSHQPSQSWIFTYLGHGTYSVTPSYASGMRLDAAGAGTASPTALDIYQSNGTKAQYWTVTPTGYGTYAIHNSYVPYDDLAMTVNGAGGVDLETDTGSAAQQWTFGS